MRLGLRLGLARGRRRCGLLRVALCFAGRTRGLSRLCGRRRRLDLVGRLLGEGRRGLILLDRLRLGLGLTGWFCSVSFRNKVTKTSSALAPRSAAFMECTPSIGMNMPFCQRTKQVAEIGP